jgi:glycosyltransferase involved in cell wall biosynthesis
MKILYCLADASKPGGMERMISAKANYLCSKYGHQIMIATTDRASLDNFFYYSPSIKFYYLDINYSELNTIANRLKRIITHLKKRRLHRRRLEALLLEHRPNIAVSTCTHELTMLCKIKDGSKKIAELHFSKPYIKIENRNSGHSLVSRLLLQAGEYYKYLYLNRYDVFAVLTREDAKRWKHVKRVVVIPNMVAIEPHELSPLDASTAVAVGRLTTQKGFIYLLKIWEKVSRQMPHWNLHIYGQGEDLPMLQQMANKLGIARTVSFLPPVQRIEEAFLDASIFAFTSIYEGFGLALAEAQTCGLPCVSFDCPSGPSEIINDGQDGFLVKTKDIDTFAKKMLLLMSNQSLRRQMGYAAIENAQRFAPDTIMPRWQRLFTQLAEKR